VAILTVAAFAAIAVSLVDARRPLDRHVSRSFDQNIPRHFGATAAARSHGCKKREIYYYLCSASVHPHKRPVSTIYWLVMLHDDGCWTALIEPPIPAPAELGPATRRAATFVGCGA
jgi:hypothetical protein